MTNVSSRNDSLPFSQLSNTEFQDICKQSQIDMNNNELTKLKNLTFNPFSTNSNGKTYLTLNSNLDPDQNYYNQIITHVESCDYHDEDTFKCLTKDSKDDEFSLLHLNIRSILNKFDDLKAYLNSLEYNFSVIGLSETWLNQNNCTDFPLPCYHYIGKVRNNKHGGGVGLYVNCSYQFRERDDLAVNIDDIIESQFIELTTKPKNTLVGIIYRPPNSKIDQFIECLTEMLQKLDLQNKKCYLMGDFNLDLLKIDENQYTKDFINQMFSSTFYPLISKPTRITNISATLIDNIFVNDLEECHRCGILYTDLSDHLPVFQITFSLKKGNDTHCDIKYRLMNKNTVDRLCKDLKNEDWNDIYDKTDPQEAYNYFYGKLFKLYEKNIPLIKTKNKGNIDNQKIPWVTKGILKSRKTKNKLYKKFIKNPNERNESIYKTYRNKFNKIKKAAKKHYYNKEFNEHKGNLRYSWKLIKEVINKNKVKMELSDHFKVNETMTSDPVEISNKFNEYFINVGPKLAERIQNNNVNFTTFLGERSVNSIFLDAVTEKEVEIEISNLSGNKSCGHDEIPPKLVKEISKQIVKPLTHIYNQSLLTGVIPNELKIALVTPVFKANSKEEFSNYRPISVLPCFSKILEKIMYKRVMKYLDMHSMLFQSQYGFRKKHSTNLATIELVTKILQAIDNSEYTIGVFLDLAKAFDTVNHEILLKKLEHYGIRGIALEWFKNYLTNRKQIIKYKSEKSESLTIKCGVPQGSVLGPLLFLIYMNDISRSSEILSIILFADDTNLFFSHKNLFTLKETMNRELSKIASWLSANKLSLNIKKTHFIIFKSRGKKSNQHVSIIINNQEIEQVKCTKFLGLYIDDEFTWKYHIDQVASKISKMTGILAKARHYLSLKTLQTIYDTMVYPYLTYCNIVWASTYPSRLKSLFMLQKKIVRIMTFAKYKENSKPLFLSLKILNIYELNIYLMALFMYSYFNENLPSYFNNYFKLNEMIHSHNTRTASNIFIDYKRTNYGKFSLKFRGAQIWNKLPKDLKLSKSYRQFKQSSKVYVQNYMYSLS